MNIAIITGGISTERQISIESAKYFFDNLKKLGYNVDLYIFFEDQDKFLKFFKKYDLVIPIVHGISGEDGQITAFLKTLGSKYLFSDFEVLSFTLNKYKTNLFVNSLGLDKIFVPDSILVQNIKDFDFNKIKDFEKIIIKPNKGGSSINTYIVNVSEISLIKKYIETILSYDEVIIQKAVSIKKEFTVSIFGDYDKNPFIIGITEVKTDKSFFDYEAKYKGKSIEMDFLPKEFIEIFGWNLWNDININCLKIYKSLKIKTLARIDILQDFDGKIYFLEINTIPGFTKYSIYPRLAKQYFGGNKFFERVIKI